MNEAEITRLRAKANARRGKPGFAANIEAIDAEIARLEAMTFTYRDNATGQFVTAEYALANPETTHLVEET